MPDPRDVSALEQQIGARRRPDRRILVREIGSGPRPALSVLSEPDVERLIRLSLLDITPGAALLIAGYPRAGQVATIARLVIAGRLELIEEYLEEPLLTGARPQAARPPEEPPPGPGPGEDTGWIEVVLVDEQDRPIPGEDYRITLADGTPRTGKLDTEGKVRLDGIPQGTCWVQFPSLGLRSSTTTA